MTRPIRIRVVFVLGALLSSPFLHRSANAQETTAQSTFSVLKPDGNGIAALQQTYSIRFDGTVAAAIRLVAQTAGVDVSFDQSLPGLSSHISLSGSKESAARLLLRIVGNSPLSVRVSSSGQIVIVPRRESKPAKGTISGQVRDAATGEPIGDVRVEAQSENARTLSKSDGAFSIANLAPGNHRLQFLRIGYRPRVVDVSSSDDAPVQKLNVTLEQAAVALASVRVSPGQFGVMETSAGTPHSLSREEIRTNPQLGEDVFRAVNKLPGLSANDLSAKFFVRGGAGSELYVSLDGVELYEPFHLKDIDAALSIVDVESIGGIDLSTGGFSAEYGDRLTGVFRMTSIQPPAEGGRHAVGLSVTNLRGMSQGGFANGRGGWVASARRGYLDLALRLTNSDDSIKPRYYDAFAKVQYDLGSRQRVAAHVLHAGDKMRYVAAGDPTIYSGYGSTYGWITWDAGIGSRLSSTAVASVSRLTWDRRGDQTEQNQQVLSIEDNRSFDVAALRQDFKWSLSDRALLRFGAELKHEDAKYDYLSWVRRGSIEDGELLFSFDSTISGATPSGNQLGGYAAQRVAFSRLVIEGGLRFDHQTNRSESQWSPRISAAWNASSGTTIRAAWGRYFQSQPLFELQTQDGVSDFARAELAEHRVIGIEQKLPLGIQGRLEAYQRLLSRQHPRFLNALNALDVFPELMSDRLRIDPGSGEARGIEFLLRPSSRRSVDWSATYALASIEDDIAGRKVPRTIDQRHTFSADVSYRAPTGKWRVSAGWLYHSGWPYTPNYFRTDTVFANGNQALLSISDRLGELNSGRLPPYYRLDFRATRYMEVRGARIAVFADIFNALNRENARGFDYDLRFNPIRVVRVVDTQVPRLPTIGVTWEF